MKPIHGFPKYFATEAGDIYSAQQKHLRLLRPSLSNRGYKRVILVRDGKRFSRLVHRLVLETFVGPCPPGMESCHGVGGQQDNSRKNLSWDTKQNNLNRDRVRDGTSNRGEQHGMARLNSLTIRVIRRSYGRRGIGGLSAKALAAVFGLAPAYVSNITTRKNWKHI